MEKIPTAWEIFKKYSDKANRIQEMHFEEMMIEFAKLHVEAALENVLENVPYLGFTDTVSYSQIKEAVLNSYSLDNVK